MKMKKILAVMAVVSMTAAMAAGCGSSEEEGKTETNAKNGSKWRNGYFI